MDVNDFEALKRIRKRYENWWWRTYRNTGDWLASAFKKDSGDSRAIKVTINPEKKIY